MPTVMTRKCGCEYATHGDAFRECPLHAAAPALLTALIALTERVPFSSHLRRVQSGQEHCKGCPACDARTAIARATGD